MTEPGTTAIVGLGLIGGSLARDLAARDVRVIAFDSDPAVIDAAIDAGIVTQSLDPSLAGIESASTIVIATPVDAALDTLATLAPRLHPNAVVTDVGSVKQPIGDRAEHLGLGDRFVGSHPLAGDHRSGWGASRQCLFAGMPVFVCPTSTSDPDTATRIHDFWVRLGANVARVDPAVHDREMAWLSHLPQIASSALATAIVESGLPSERLGPGGRDATRLAASSPAMWTAISMANATNILPALDELERAIGGFRDALTRGDEVTLRKLFENARGWRH